MTQHSTTTTTNSDEWENTLYHGDCNDILETLPNNIIDCIVTSPPYWGARDYDTENQIGFENSIDAYTDEITTVFEKLKRCLSENGTVFLSLGDMYQSTAPGTQNTTSNLNEKTSESQGGHYRFDSGLKQKSMMCLPERIITTLVDNGWVLRNKITWVKSNPLPEPSAVDRFKQSWEPIYFLTAESQYYFNEDENTTVDHWTVPTASRNTMHPAPLPIEICEKCITAGCKPGDTVLDPFCGSGATCIAAHKRNRDYVGIDINEDYIKETQETLQSNVITNNKNITTINGQQTLTSFD